MENRMEIMTPQGYEEGDKPKRMKMKKKRTSCERCGNCCSGGGPVLLKDDLALFSSGVLSHADVYTIRENERVGSKENVYESFLEMIKLREAENGACSFYAGNGECRIYEKRPYQCRAYKCWSANEIDNPGAALAEEDILIGLEGNCITRKDFFAGIDLVMDVIKRHEEKCSYERLNAALEKASEGDEEAMDEVMDMFQYDASIRPFLTEKFSIPQNALDLILGRPLTETIRGF
ncbi:MAG: YkgJ family cysteine cluster protein, partial [Thermodesulfovibrionales bacterium]